MAAFSGEYGGLYGVDLFAPTRLYAEPDDLRSFVNERILGLCVILDVFYTTRPAGIICALL